MSQTHDFPPEDGDWICCACNVALVQRKTQARYLGGAFDLTLAHCPECGQYFVPKELAEGKMLEVETLLEDK